MLRNIEAQTSPIEIIIVVMTTIMSMVLLVMVAGTYIDGFMNIINSVDIPLSTWGKTMMNNIPIRYAQWVFIVPGFFVLLTLVWAVKTVIKRHEYTTQDQQFMNDEFN